MPTRRSEHGVAFSDDKIYVVGGREPGKNSDVVEAHDLKSRQWDTVARLPTPLNHFGIAANNGKPSVVGTISNDAFSNRTLKTIPL